MCAGLRYLFVDMNSYFASVEQHLRPELRGKPVAVVPMMSDTTCCLAASYEAKASGVKTGTPVREARQMCPGIRLVEARTEKYIHLHHRIVAAVDSCLPVSAVLSIDEMVCKLWGTDRTPAAACDLAQRVKQAIAAQTGPELRCSIGIAPNRFLAKTASDMQKPDGLTLIQLDELPCKLSTLRLTDLCGIGPRMAFRLAQAGIFSVDQLCRATESELSHAWGSQVLGKAWWRKLRGEDVPEQPTQRRSVGHSHVLPPELRTDALARRVLIRLLHKAAVRLRSLRYWTRALAVQVSFLGRGDWHACQSFPAAQDTLTLIQAVNQLWQKKPPGKPLKVGVVLQDLVAVKNAPGSLLTEDRRNLELSRAMDQVNQRFGSDRLYFGGMHHMADCAPTRIAFTHIPDVA